MDNLARFSFKKRSKHIPLIDFVIKSTFWQTTNPYLQIWCLTDPYLMSMTNFQLTDQKNANWQKQTQPASARRGRWRWAPSRPPWSKQQSWRSASGSWKRPGKGKKVTQMLGILTPAHLEDSNELRACFSAVVCCLMILCYTPWKRRWTGACSSAVGRTPSSSQTPPSAGPASSSDPSPGRRRKMWFLLWQLKKESAGLNKLLTEAANP